VRLIKTWAISKKNSCAVGHEVFRQMLEKAAQQKADAASPQCPHCQNKLSRLSAGHFTTHSDALRPHPHTACSGLLSTLPQVALCR